MKQLLLLIAFVALGTLIGCKSTPTPTLPLLVDPTLSWGPVATNCDGEAITGVTYNVYYINGPGPFPLVQTGTDEVPCGVQDLVDTTQATKGNPAPVVGNSYHLNLADGEYTFAVEAIGQNGSRSGVSNVVTKTVRDRPATATLTVN